jgi:hypothetical protein
MTEVQLTPEMLCTCINVLKQLLTSRAVQWLTRLVAGL